MSETLTKPQNQAAPKPALKLKKALSIANVQTQSVIRLAFTGVWFEAFKKPQDRGLWFVWGESGSGKSVFLMMLAKMFALLGHKVLYNLLEEETDDSDYIDRMELCQMSEVSGMVDTVSYNFEELDYYLSKKSTKCKVVFIDSATYFIKDWDKLKAFLKKYKKLIFVISGHAEGKKPRTEFERSIRFHSKMKIFVNGFLALCQGRTVGPNGGRFIIYQEGYDKLNGANLN